MKQEAQTKNNESNEMPPEEIEKANARTVFQNLDNGKKLDIINEKMDRIEHRSVIEALGNVPEEQKPMAAQVLRHLNRGDASLPEQAVYWLEDHIAPEGSVRRGLLKGGLYGYGTYKGGKLAWRGLKAAWAFVRGNPTKAVEEGVGAFQDLAQ